MRLADGADHHRDVPDLAAEALDEARPRLECSQDELGLIEEIQWWIPDERELGEEHEAGARAGRSD